MTWFLAHGSFDSRSLRRSLVEETSRETSTCSLKCSADEV